MAPSHNTVSHPVNCLMTTERETASQNGPTSCTGHSPHSLEDSMALAPFSLRHPQQQNDPHFPSQRRQSRSYLVL